MKHILDGGQSRCSCVGWWCKICNASNKLISWHNDIMQFGLDKQTMLDNLQEINDYMNKIDAYTMYQYLTKEITKEQLDEYMETYTPKKRTPKLRKKSEIKDTSNLVNPDEECVYDWDWVWARCKFCNSIKKYHKWQKCLRFVWDIEEK